MDTFKDFKPEKLIRWSVFSAYLSNHARNIKPSYTPVKYEKAAKLLKTKINEWKEEVKKM